MKKCYKECFCKCCERTLSFLNKIAPVMNLVVRFYMANIIFMFGLDKIQNWDATMFLFTNEYQIPVLPNVVSAVIVTAIQLIAPIMLVVGYGARFAALILFVMTLLSNFFYQQFIENYYWMLIFAMLMSYGSDKLSLDHYLCQKRAKK